MIAAKLQSGDEVRVVSPAVSLGFIPEDQKQTAREQLEGLGLRCSFSRNAEVMDRFDSSPVEARVSDLHEAFADPGVKAMLTTLGGYNSNGLLGYLDYDLIRANPKILCGFSDITALATAIYARTGLVSYSGPHFTTFGMKRGIDYTLEYFELCLMREEPFEVLPADHWSDDPWYQDQENRDFVPNPGYEVMHEGEAEGMLLGGHLGTLCHLFGTPFMPDLAGSILLLEDDEEALPHHFGRELQSLIHQPGFEGVRGIVFGKFQRASNMDQDTLTAIVESKRDGRHACRRRRELRPHHAAVHVPDRWLRQAARWEGNRPTLHRCPLIRQPIQTDLVLTSTIIAGTVAPLSTTLPQFLCPAAPYVWIELSRVRLAPRRHYQQFAQHSGALVIFGNSLGEQDQHLVHAMRSWDDRRIGVSVYPNAPHEIIAYKAELHKRLPRAELLFFDSTTYPLGATTLRISHDQ